MTLRIRSSVICASLALPFQIRQCRRSTSATMAVLACIRPGASVDNPLAASLACCSRMAMWNQSAIGGFVSPCRGKNRTQAATAVGERGHHGVGSPADRLEATPDQHRDVGVGLRDSAEDLPLPVGCFHVADADLQMPFAFVAAPDEGRVYGDGDARRGGRRLAGGGIAKLLADFQCMAAQSLGARSAVHREKMRQHTNGDTIGQQGGKMRAELVQLRGRPAMRRPTGTGLAMTAADAAKPRKPDRYHAEQRRDLADAPVQNVTFTATARAVWP